MDSNLTPDPTFNLDAEPGGLDRFLSCSPTAGADRKFVLATEILAQGFIDHPANGPLLCPLLPSPAGNGDQEGLYRFFTEVFYFSYQLLFLFHLQPYQELSLLSDLSEGDGCLKMDLLYETIGCLLKTEASDDIDYLDLARSLIQKARRGFVITPASPLLSADGQTTPFKPSLVISPSTIPLFDPARTQLLESCSVANQVMQMVVRLLAPRQPDRRDEELSLIYEEMLAHEPAITTEAMVKTKIKDKEQWIRVKQPEHSAGEKRAYCRAGSFILRPAADGRKHRGAFYTPAEITQYIVTSTVGVMVKPIMQDLAGEAPLYCPDDIYEEIKVCDPAMGSGAFLVQACRFLAESYSQARVAAGLEDEQTARARLPYYKRRAAEKCLYGVDLDPMAVELAKLTLWLEVLVADRPLPFLDPHLRCGNSLIGAPLRQETQFTVKELSYIPDAALEGIYKGTTTEQKAAARARLQRNQEERKRLDTKQEGQTSKSEELQRFMGLALLEGMFWRTSLEMPDESLSLGHALALVKYKKDLFNELMHGDSIRRQAQQICDLWCAVWFWPEPGSLLPRQGGANVEVPEPPTTGRFLELASTLWGAAPLTLTPDEQVVYWAVVQHVAAQQRFFHWELEFPEIWGRQRKSR